MKGGATVIDDVSTSSTAQCIKNCQAKVEELQLLLDTAKAQARKQGVDLTIGYMLHRAECKVALVQGVLGSISTWLSLLGEGDNL